jgi:hypothetical protein
MQEKVIRKEDRSVKTHKRRKKKSWEKWGLSAPAEGNDMIVHT